MPRLTEITPKHLRCPASMCPAIFTADNGDLVIIGKQLDGDLLKEVSGKVGPDEYAVRISAEFLANLPGSGAGGGKW